MWLFDALLSGFQFPTEDWRMQLFRVLLGFACTVKFGVALTHGGLTRLDSGTLGRYELFRKFGDRSGHWLGQLYRPLLFIRLVAAVFVLLGVYPKVAACVVVVGLAHEYTYAPRFNTLYLTLLTLCLLPAGNLGQFFEFSQRVSPANTWSQFLIVLITIDLYWNSAWQKIRSRQFTSGLLMAQFVHFIGRIRHRLTHREFFYPKLMLSALGGLDEPAIARWRVLSMAVILLEIALPFGLLCAPLRPLAVAVGIGMHLCFTFLMPRQLLGFSISTTSSYVLFSA